MRIIDRIYIDGEFATARGDVQPLTNPTTEEPLGAVRLASREDARAAIAAAVAAFPAMAATSKAERLGMLERMHAAVSARAAALAEATILEYGAPRQSAEFAMRFAIDSILEAANALRAYEFTRWIRDAEVVMEPLGVVGVITPWNANTSFICSKLATALAAGCTAVIKPSEISALQTEILTEALHEAGLPPGACNIVTGAGDAVGDELSRHPDVAKLSFTGSTAVGKAIMRASADTLKRLTLELGGKSPVVILDDADPETAARLAVAAAFRNNGQACVAGSRALVPRSLLGEVLPRLKAAAEATVVGDPDDPKTELGPLASRAQWERVQGYIRKGVADGATLLTGGEGRPGHLPRGYFVRPTVFVDATNDMAIAREEIFGPVLSVIAYEDETDAVRIANDTPYGLRSYVVSADAGRAHRIGAQLQTGQVMINGFHNEPQAPFGGFKQSGLGRELGVFGLEAHLEPKVLLGRPRDVA